MQDEKSLAKQLHILEIDRNKLQNEIDDIIYTLSNFATKYKNMNEENLPNSLFQIIQIIEEAFNELFKLREEATARFKDLDAKSISANMSRQNEDLTREINENKIDLMKIRRVLVDYESEIVLKNKEIKELQFKLNQIEMRSEELIAVNDAFDHAFTGVYSFINEFS